MCGHGAATSGLWRRCRMWLVTDLTYSVIHRPACNFVISFSFSLPSFSLFYGVRRMATVHFDTIPRGQVGNYTVNPPSHRRLFPSPIAPSSCKHFRLASHSLPFCPLASLNLRWSVVFRHFLGVVRRTRRERQGTWLMRLGELEGCCVVRRRRRRRRQESKITR